VGVLAATELVCAGAHADEAPVALAYEAPPECPDARAFDAEVAKRAPSANPRDARVAIRGATSLGYDGELVIGGLTRTVHAGTCSETVEALALALALASTDETDEPDETTAPQMPANDHATTPAAPIAGPPPKRDAHTRPVIGIGLGGASGVGPGLAPGLALFGGIDVGTRSFRIGVNAARSPESSTSHGTARFERWTVHLDACPVSLREGRLYLAPCIRFDAGALRGSGESLENAASKALVWLSLGAGGRIAFDLTRTIFVEGEARAVAPLLRHVFFVRPNDDIHHVPAVAAEAFVSVGYRFSK